MKGKEPPMLIRIKANMLVVTARWGSMPNAINAGTVMRDVLPVTTLMTLVKKKTALRMTSFSGDTKRS